MRWPIPPYRMMAVVSRREEEVHLEDAHSREPVVPAADAMPRDGRTSAAANFTEAKVATAALAAGHRLSLPDAVARASLRTVAFQPFLTAAGFISVTTWIAQRIATAARLFAVAAT